MGSKSNTAAPTTTTSQADNRVVLGNDAASIGAFGTYMRDSGNSWADLSNVGNTSTVTNDMGISDSSVRTWDDHSLTDYSSAFTDNSNRAVTTSVTDQSVRDFSTQLSDSSSRSYAYDGSNRSTTSTAYTSDSRDSSSRSYALDSSNRSTTDSHNIFNYTTTATDAGAVEIARMGSALQQALSEGQGDAVKTIARFGADAITSQAQAATDLFATGSAEASKAWGHTIDASAEMIDKLLTTAQGTITGAQTVARDAISSYMPSENKAMDSSTKVAIIGALAVLAAAFITKRA